MLREIPEFRKIYRKQVILKEQSKAEVSRVIVAPEWRGMGLGEALGKWKAFLPPRILKDAQFQGCLPHAGRVCHS